MKTPTARRLPSGSYFCRVTVNGTRYEFTRPTKKEAETAALAAKLGKQKAYSANITLWEAVDNYIASRQNILSPATIAGYRRIQRSRFQKIMRKTVKSLSPEILQNAVNDEAGICGAKTLKNAWAFLCAVIAEETNARPQARLPQAEKKEAGFLSPEEIKLFIEAAKGDSVEIPALLALSSLRMSEVLAVRWEDVDMDNDVISVHRSIVRDEHNKQIEKKVMKNASSVRQIPIIPPLKEALRKCEKADGYVLRLRCEHNIREGYRRICSKAGVPYVGAHGLRHSFASLCYYLGIDEMTAMRIGGWANYYTMRNIYTHLSEKDMSDRTEKFTKFFQNL